MKPEPKPTHVVCTVCGLAWDAHESAFPAKGKKPAVTLDDCVRVLKAELAKRPRQNPYVVQQLATSGWPPAVYGLPRPTPPQ